MYYQPKEFYRIVFFLRGTIHNLETFFQFIKDVPKIIFKNGTSLGHNNEIAVGVQQTTLTEEMLAAKLLMFESTSIPIFVKVKNISPTQTSNIIEHI